MLCDEKEELYALWTQLACGICNSIYRKLFDRFHSFSEIYNCNDYSFLNGKHKCEAKLKEKDLSDAFELQKKCKSGGIGIFTFFDDRFPKLLRPLQAPPAVLYYIGKPCDLNGIVGVAVVGTRNMTEYGAGIAEDFSFHLSLAGATIVSGLAKGIDTCAHRGAVRAGAYTIGVLGTPIDEIYPKENYKAFHTLYERGLVVSEMYPGCPRTKADFPNRNRIISGLCAATVVVEAGEHSGALITASHAIYQDRLLFAVPGSIGDTHAGTNMLIKKGVRAATCAEDILEDLAVSYPNKIFPENLLSAPRLYSMPYTGYIPQNPIHIPVKHKETQKPKTDPKPPETPAAEQKPTQKETPAPFASAEPDSLETEITKLLRHRSMTVDQLAAETRSDTGELLAALTILEIDGKIRSSAGNIITLNEL